MRYLLSILLLIGTTQAHSADWTPVFAYLEHNKNSDNGKLFDTITASMSQWVMQGEGDASYPVAYKLLDSAKRGNYPNVPQPYRQDMLPAKKLHDYAVIVPLKNATLYGLPIKSLTDEVSGGDNFWGSNFYVNFGKLSKTQHNNLVKKVKLKTRCQNGKPNDVWNSRSFKKSETGETLLAIEHVEYDGCE